MTIVMHDINGERYEINDVSGTEWDFKSKVGEYCDVILDDKGGEIDDN